MYMKGFWLDSLSELVCKRHTAKEEFISTINNIHGQLLSTPYEARGKKSVKKHTDIDYEDRV